MRELTVNGFRGMNNLPSPPSEWVDKERRLTPQYVVNADLTDKGAILKRRGYRKVLDLVDPHSLWAGSIMLCVANGEEHPVALHLVTEQSAQELCGVDGPRARVTYEEVDGKVFMSNPYWNQVLDIESLKTSAWGVPNPPPPSVSMTAGNIPPGIYLLAFTKILNGVRGGNGPVLQVIIEGMAQGIRLNNLASDYEVWITHPNGGKLFKAEVSGGGVITGEAPLTIPLDTFGAEPAPRFTHFCFKFGRMWGCLGKYVYYSEPHSYEVFRRRLPFLEDLVMIAPVANGLFVSSLKSTWILAGHDPGKMSVDHIGDGAVPGTLTYHQVESGGYEISRKLSQLPSPVWMGPRGVVVGTHNGHLVHYTEARLKVVSRQSGAALSLSRDGMPQLLFALWGASQQKDSDLEFIFTNNRLYVPEPVRVIGSGGIIFGGE